MDDTPSTRAPAAERGVRIAVAGGASIEGDLAVPGGARGVVVFAHGSGSSRHSPRNRLVAAQLQRAHLATLLVDLLTADEEAVDLRTRQLRFDVEMLAGRLTTAAAWVRAEPDVGGLPIGYFGASTGAGAALIAAADQPGDVVTVVSRGGRPDLAGDRLARVRCPTLLIVGAADPVVVELNREALGRMRAEAVLELVPGATHLFEEPGALEQVADLAERRFTRHMAAAVAGGAP